MRRMKSERIEQLVLYRIADDKITLMSVISPSVCHLSVICLSVISLFLSVCHLSVICLSVISLFLSVCHLSVCLFAFLSVCHLSVCLSSVCHLFICHLFVPVCHLSVICLSVICPSVICLSVCLPSCLSVICLSVCHLSVHLPDCLSVCLIIDETAESITDDTESLSTQRLEDFCNCSYIRSLECTNPMNYTNLCSPHRRYVCIIFITYRIFLM